MASSALAERLAQSQPMFSAWCGLPDPSTAALLAREDVDAVTLDMQHGAIDFAAVVRALPLVMGAGKPAIARIPVGEFATASRLLDAGAAGIIAPMINTLADAEAFASFVKYPPVGERSWGPHGGLLLTGMSQADYFATANGLTVSFAMVETRESLGLVDDILGVSGVDGIFIGPADLSIALSGGAQVDPMSRAVDEALAHALARTRAAGKRIGVYAHSGERAGELARRGFDLVAVGSDSAMLRAGAQAMLKGARS